MKKSIRLVVTHFVKRFSGISPVILLFAVLYSSPGLAQVIATASQGTPGPTSYSTLKGAFDAINAGTHQGNITLSITGNTTEIATATLNASGNGSASYTSVNIKPAAGITPTITGNLSSASVIRLNGSNNVTIDGSNSGTSTKDLTLINTSGSISNVLAIGSVGTTPISNISIRNTVIINGTNTSTAVVAGDAGVIGSPGYFNNITLQNNDIRKTYIGVYFYSATNTSNSNIKITGNDLNATGSNAIRLVGIYAQSVNGLTISDNNIGNFDPASPEFDRGIWLATGTVNATISKNNISGLAYSGSSNYAPIGINISPGVSNANIVVNDNIINTITSSGSFSPIGIYSYTAASGIAIANNKISTIKNTNVTGYGAAGIILANTINTAATKVYNNFIWDITGTGGNSFNANDNGNGIVVDGGGGYDIDFNTVVLNTDPVSTGAHKSSCLLITVNVTATGTINVRNNILANLQTTGNANSRYALSNASTASVFGTIDYNDYYSVSGNLGISGTTSATTIAQMQTLMGGNAHALNVEPVFVASNDLHLNPSANNMLDGKGTPVPGITTDIDGDTRNSTAPDPGADEFIVCPLITFTTQPANGSICEKGGSSFSTAATNASTYQWQVDAGSGFTNIADDAVYSGTKTANLILTNIPASYNGYIYRCLAKGRSDCPAVPSNTATLTVNPSKTVTEEITICQNQLPYNWNGKSIPAGGNAVATFTTPSLLTGCDSTVTLNLVVNTLPTITLQPASGAAASGSDISFSVTATGGGTFSYRWQEDAGSGFTDLTNNSVYSGVTSSELKITGVKGSMNNYRYQCIITNTCGSSTSGMATLTVNKLPQSLNFSTQTTGSTVVVTYGDPAIDGAATASSGGAVIYASSNTTVATVDGSGKVTILTAGTTVITASQSGNNDYHPASDISFTIQVNKKTITVTTTPASKTYGDPDPALAYTFTPSLVGADAFSGTLQRAAGENTGTYVIGQNNLSLNSNYILTYIPANFTITKKAITVTATSASKTYGDPDPVLTYTHSPALAGTDQFTGSLNRAPGENVGTYTIQQNTLTLNGNYTITYIANNLIIKPRTITITATPQNKTYGDPDPSLTYTISQALAPGDQFSGSLSRVPGENAGVYGIGQGTLALNGNYILNYNGANLIIGKRDLSIRADNQSRPYGAPNPALTMTYNGFVNGDNELVITPPMISTTATTSSLPGNYPVTLAGGIAANYRLMLSNGTLTVESVRLQIMQQPADQSVCKGLAAQFRVTTSVTPAAAPVTYQWEQSMDGINWQTIAGATAPVYTTTGNAMMYLRCTIGAPGVTSQTQIAQLNIHPSPLITAGKSNDIGCANNTAQLLASGALHYRWSPEAGLNDSYVSNPIAAPNVTTTYIVTGTDANGCIGSAYVTLNVAPRQYLVPTAFSPNGDGKNDCFRVSNWSNVTQFELSIYSRTGMRIFYTNNPASCWDGTYNGQPQPTATYVYFIKAVTPCGPIERKGTVILIR